MNQKENRDGFIPVEGGKVYYRIFGESAPKTPLLVLHGGPGFDHKGLLGLHLLSDERPVIFYDQLGGGRSDRPQNSSLWKIDRFVRELSQVRTHLKLNTMILFGASWGTMLAVDYMLTKPQGVVGLILSSPCLSVQKWKEDTTSLLRAFPQTIQATIAQHEALGTTSSKEYQDAVMEFVKKHICRLDPFPQDMLEAFQEFNVDVYNTMWGPSEWFPVGNLKDYERVDSLRQIQVPSLFLCGRFDEATPKTVAFYQKNLPGSELVVFENSSHMAIREEETNYIAAIRQFLQKNNV